MEAQRKTALWSVGAAIALIALKLGTGLATHSLGLISSAADSGTDLIAALLTFFALPSLAQAAGVQPRFDLSNPDGGPFPSNRWTTFDWSQKTGLRVNPTI